jgi:hypothetical protein
VLVAVVAFLLVPGSLAQQAFTLEHARDWLTNLDSRLTNLEVTRLTALEALVATHAEQIRELETRNAAQVSVDPTHILKGTVHVSDKPGGGEIIDLGTLSGDMCLIQGGGIADRFGRSVRVYDGVAS